MSDDYFDTEFPPNTVLGQIRMDVHADTAAGTITIMYDKPLGKEILGIEYNVPTRDLVFEFTPGKMLFGMPLTEAIGAIAEKAANIILIQMDTKKDEPIMGLNVPLTIVR